MVSTETTQRTVTQSETIPSVAENSTRSIAAKPAAFEPVDMKAVIGVGAP